METEIPRSNLAASLFFQQGTSDKVYQLKVEASNGGYVVNYTYGRRGAKLRTGSKTPTPLNLIQATMLFNQIIAEKTGEGYLPDKDCPALGGLMQSRDTRRATLFVASQLQEEIWSRNYSHSWGIREEWATLLSEHPELFEMSFKEAADAVLANLAKWSPDLSAKEIKARRLPPEQAEKVRILIERALAAITIQIPIGPESAGVSISEIDPGRVPEIRPGTWIVVQNGKFMGVHDSKESAIQRANTVVERSAFIPKLSVAIDDKSGRFEIRGEIMPRPG